MSRESELVFAGEDEGCIRFSSYLHFGCERLGALLVVHVEISRMCVSVGHSLKDANTKATTLFIYQLHRLILTAIMDSEKYVRYLSQVFSLTNLRIGHIMTLRITLVV
jgi:hypothetical protein